MLIWALPAIVEHVDRKVVHLYPVKDTVYLGMPKLKRFIALIAAFHTTNQKYLYSDSTNSKHFKDACQVIILGSMTSLSW